MRVKIIERSIDKKLSKKQAELKKIPSKFYDFFLKTTPKDTGNARRRTRLVSDTIHADYPYAGRLNRGWSRQAPDGMVRPAIKYIRQLINKIMGS